MGRPVRISSYRGLTMKRRLIVIMCVALSACGKQAEAPTNEQKPAPAPAAIVPGMYRQATTLLEFKDPSLSAADLATAVKSIGTTQTVDRCVTPEMVSNPKKLVLSSTEQGCTVNKSVWEDGKIDLALSCPEDDSERAGSLDVTGTFDRERYSIDAALRGDPGEITRMKVDAKRLGDCPK